MKREEEELIQRFMELCRHQNEERICLTGWLNHAIAAFLEEERSRPLDRTDTEDM
jgi:hypothetical protein